MKNIAFTTSLPRRVIVLLLASCALALAAASPSFAQTLRINEVMAEASRRDGIICDENGDPEDWIEIANLTGAPIALGGYRLTDNPALPMQWTFPAGVTIPINGYLLVFASGKDRAVAGSELHTNFELRREGDYVGLLAPNGSIVDEISPSYPEQIEDVSYGRTAAGAFDYFLNPTPNAANSTMPGLPASPPEFSLTSGTFTSSSIQVALSSTDPGAVIRYTVDRSIPTAGSTLYTGPITVTQSTQIRARAFVPGMPDSPVRSETYLRLAADMQNFTSDLPVVIIEGFGSGRPDSDTVMHWSIFEPGELGRSSVTAAPDFANRGRMKVRGSSTAGFEKYSLAMEAWDETDRDSDVEPLGLPEEADWILSGRWNFDRALMRNELIYALSNQIGRYAVRTRFVEVFINTNDGIVSYANASSSGDYMGVYSLMEKPERDDDRIDVNRLDKGDLTLPDVTGGYVFKQDRRDPGDSGFSVGGMNSMAYVYPKESEILPAQRNYLLSHLGELAASLDATNGIHPSTGLHFSDYIDVGAWLDHHWLNVLAMNVDAFRLSAYFHKDRNGKVAAGPIWDFDRSMESTDGRDNNPEAWDGTGDSSLTWFDGRYPWWGELLSFPDARHQHTERWFELRQGVFSWENIESVIDSFAAEINESQARNFIRWSNRPPRTGPGGETGHAGEVAILKNWLQRRLDWIDSQYPRPVFSPPGGGAVAPGTNVDVTSLIGDVYYTTDGTDPRLPGGGVSPGATRLGGGSIVDTVLPAGSVWKYLDTGAVLDSSDVVQGHGSYGPSSWKHPSFDDSGWSAGPAQLGYGDNDEATQVGFGPNSGSKYPTTYFRTTFQAPDGIDDALEVRLEIVRDDGAIVYLNGVEVARSNVGGGAISGSSYSGMGAVGGGDESTFHSFPVSADRFVPGTNTLAVEIHQDNGNSSDLSFDLRILATFPGEGNDGIDITETTAVLARAFDGQVWGPAVRSTYIVGNPARAGDLAVSEINYHPVDPTPEEAAAGATGDADFEFIEFVNVSDQTVDVTGVSVSRAFDYVLDGAALRTTLAPGEVLLLVRNLPVLEARYGSGLPIAGVWGDPSDPDGGQRLSNDGEAILITAADGSVILDFSYNDSVEWPQDADGGGATLVLASPAAPIPDHSLPQSWIASSVAGGTPGTLEGVPTGNYAMWRSANFTPAQLSDPNISGDLADAEGDGIPNLFEFVLGLDPWAQSVLGITAGSVEIESSPGVTEEFFTLTFRRRIERSPASVIAEATDDLVLWVENLVLHGAPIDNGDGTETVTYRDTVPIGSQTARYFRLKASAN